MQNYYYSAVGILALVIHLIINHVYYVRHDTRLEIRQYKHYLAAIFLYYLTDAAWGFLYEAGNIPLLYADTMCYHVAVTMSVVLCCQYIITFLKLNDRVARMLNALSWGFGLLGILAVVVNLYYPIFFHYDETGAYHTHTMRHVAVVVQIMVFGLIAVIATRKALKASDMSRSRSMGISLFGTCMVLGLVLQGLYPLLPIYSLALMLGTLIVHVFIHNEEIAVQLRKIEELNGCLQQEQQELQRQNDELHTAFSVINGLSHDYHSIFLMDKETRRIQMVRAPGEGAIAGAVKLVDEAVDADGLARAYIDAYVMPEDQERMRRLVCMDNVLEQLSHQDFYGVNYMRRSADGQPDYNQLAVANADTADGKHQLVFGFRDVNDILRQEQALRQELSEAKEAAEAANAAKTTFLFSMSHDIRTPMNAIIGFRDLLEKNQEDPQKRANYLRKIQESSNVLLSIINNVLEMARIEKGVLKMDESVWSAELLNDSLYSVFSDMMEQKGLRFTRQIDVQHHYVYCDPQKLREVFINILSNAYKYTPEGGHVHMHLQEQPSDRPGYALYRTTISDTGVGMAEEFLPHLFEEFSREHSSTMSKIEGTGLGMPIVKRLVDFMQGTIEVQSRKGEGTTFTVALYHRIAERTDIAVVDEQITEDGLQGKRILLAEDNELNAEIAMAVLEEIGLQVDRAADGQECVEMLQAAEPGTYDVVLMDVQMPRMNGYEATLAIRALADERKAQTKILAMTANAFEEDRREALRVGMNGHLSKPINVHELTRALAATLR